MLARKVKWMPHVRRRSAGKLMMIGASSITLDQHMPHVRILTTREALDADRHSLRGDYMRVMRRGSREREDA